MSIEERLLALQNRGFYLAITCAPNKYSNSFYDLYLSRWDAQGSIFKNDNYPSLADLVSDAEEAAAKWEAEHATRD